MKKLLTAAGILLLAAVFMSGCITTPASDDPAVGIWKNPQPATFEDGLSFDSLTFVINADGTAYSLGKFTGEPVYGKIDYTWKNAGNGKYVLTLTDAQGPESAYPLEFTVAGDVLSLTAGPDAGIDLGRITLDEYIPGLWTGVADYKGNEDVQALAYFEEDGTGEMAVFTPGVEGSEDVYTIQFTWKAEGDAVIMTGEKGVSSKLPVVNGELIYDGEFTLHKYCIEDDLYGIWKSSEPHVVEGVSYTAVEIIRYGGTGVQLWTKSGTDEVVFTSDFTWEWTGPYTFKVLYQPHNNVGEYTMIGLRLFDGEIWYNKVGLDELLDYSLNKGIV